MLSLSEGGTRMLCLLALSSPRRRGSKHVLGDAGLMDEALRFRRRAFFVVGEVP